ncbi:MAG TPA: translocation/assembly module TamB domain-containing protein [Steroidobacteraceae bacterium]|nr:translocation/assembly module TamB domain-containing protein [Steroidobacteraceae bacterium]
MARKALKLMAWTAGSLLTLVVLLILAVVVAGNSDAGRAMIERVTLELTGGKVRLSGLGGSFPTSLTLGRLELSDGEGVWLTADAIALTWSPLPLLERRISVDRLEVSRLDMERAPRSEGRGKGAYSIPHIDVRQFAVREVRLGAPLAGREERLSLRGGLELRSLQDASADVAARRLDGDGEYAVHLKFDPKRMDGTVSVHEPASGPLENILQLPGLGALSATLNVAGPREAERVDLELTAGALTAKVGGSANLPEESADLSYSIVSSAVNPRPDLKWQRLSFDGQWRGTLKNSTASGQLQAEALELPGNASIAALHATLAAAQGTVSVRGTVDGLRIPGSEPALFQKDPVSINASMRVAEDTRPLTVQATHRLLLLKAQATTAGERKIAVQVHVPDIAPFGALAGQDVRGDADIKAQLDFRESDIGVTLGADAASLTGPSSWTAMVGPRVSLSVEGSVSDQVFSIRRAQIKARSALLSASGNATRLKPGEARPNSARARSALESYIGKVQARWEFRVADLQEVSSELAGSMQGSGAVNGAPASLNVDAQLKSSLSIRGSSPGPLSVELHARGLPTAPSASIAVQGTVDESPLALTASLERSGRELLHASIRRGEWKSVHAAGEMTIASNIEDARGHLQVEVGQLGDFNRLLGVDFNGSLTGGVEFTPRDGLTHADFQLDGKDLHAGPFAGTIHLAGQGDTRSVAAQLKVQSPDFRGYPAELSADAVMNLDTREARADRGSLDYRGLKVELKSPATISYAQGLKIDQLKLGAQGAVLELDGKLFPGLDARASLQHVGPKLMNVFFPDMVSEGTIEGSARLAGALSAPTGRLRLKASAVRFAGDQAVGLPAVDLTAGADLSGDSASLDVRLDAGTASVFTMTGKAPLIAEGAYALKLNGKLDLAVANPLFEARGMHAGGKIGVDATVGGKLDAPQIAGNVTLAGGNFRDYVRGTSLTDITAEVDGSAGTLQIKTFKATAASGSLGASGSIGVLEPKIPVDIKLTASKAQVLSSSLVTANVNADLAVKGTALERLQVAGSIHVNRAVIGIPDSLPPDVAVLDVRRRGQPVRPPSAKRLVIGLDVNLDAPRQVLVQGRGLDAELGGELRIRGTTESPQVGGKGFELVRGTFSLAGTKLNFDPTSSVSFDGAGLRKKIDPTLDFNATTTVQTNTVKLHIYGYADSPRFEFSSVPAGLGQDEIMALLLFGQPAAQLSALQVAEVGAALATLTGVGGSGSNPLARLQKSLGLDRLSVGANTVPTATGGTETQGAAIQAGRYISKRVYIEGRQATTGTSQVQVNVDLTKRLKLQTRLGNGTAIQGTTPENDPGSSIGLSYQIEY